MNTNTIQNPCLIGRLLNNSTPLNIITACLNDFIHKDEDDLIWVLIYDERSPTVKQVKKKEIIITGVESVTVDYRKC